MRLKLTVPNGETYRLDTPDNTLVGAWLKALFDSWDSMPGPGRIPVTFTLEVYG